MTRSSTEFISIGVQFSFKGVFDPVRGICVAARPGVCVSERIALFSFHYGRFSRFYIFVIADTNSTDRVGETFIAQHSYNIRTFARDVLSLTRRVKRSSVCSALIF